VIGGIPLPYRREIDIEIGDVFFEVLLAGLINDRQMLQARLRPGIVNLRLVSRRGMPPIIWPG